MIRIWSVSLSDNNAHSVKMELNEWTAQIRVYFDEQMIDSAFVMSYLGTIYRFDRMGHSFAIGVRGLLNFGGQLILTVDGRETAPGAVSLLATPMPTPSAAVPNLPTGAQFVQEVNIRETSEVYRTEEYPFDNRFGSTPFSTDRQVSQESTNEITVETNQQLSGQLGIEAAAILKAQIAAEVSNRVGYKIGEKASESQTLHFNVAANSAVTYLILWKRKIRSGEYLYMVNGSPVSVPYRMQYGLAVEVQAREFKAEE